MMGAGLGRGEDRARQAAEQAIRSPLLDNVNIINAKGVLINITGGDDIRIGLKYWSIVFKTSVLSNLPEITMIALLGAYQLR